MADFWSNNNIDPKRSFRWILVLANMPTWVIKTSGKPNFTINNITHNYVAHTFNYPGRITWNPVTVTLVDPVIPDASAKLTKILQAAGYAIPGREEDARISLNKADSTAVVGSPSIEQVDAQGRTIEKWILRNAWIESVNFGSLSYETDEMVNIELSFRYDWAEYEGDAVNTTGYVGVQPIMSNGPNATTTIEQYRNDLGKTAGGGFT